MDRLEPPNLCEQVLLHDSMRAPAGGLDSADQLHRFLVELNGLSSLHGWRLDLADQLRRFLVELNRLELASQLVLGSGRSAPSVPGGAQSA
uniref:Uncharacterized protein n=1 Tax=Fagus sylvatica TaxID=28930 RepID=A0A2N9IZ67_FAGSY